VGLPFKAGDVGGNGTITNADIVAVRQKMLNPLLVLPVGNWVFEVPSFMLNSADYPVNFQALCAGDVNGSYTPPVAP
jgi:hypothetical protein